jgi:hypothetical protein
MLEFGIYGKREFIAHRFELSLRVYLHDFNYKSDLIKQLRHTYSDCRAASVSKIPVGNAVILLFCRPLNNKTFNVISLFFIKSEFYQNKLMN